MAGYFIGGCHLDSNDVYPFYFGPEVLLAVRTSAPSHVLTLQVDGDEKAAVLWGLANYQKPSVFATELQVADLVHLDEEEAPNWTIKAIVDNHVMIDGDNEYDRGPRVVSKNRLWK